MHLLLTKLSKKRKTKVLPDNQRIENNLSDSVITSKRVYATRWTKSCFEEIEEAHRILTNQEISLIRRLYTDTNLQRFYGVSDSTIEKIQNNFMSLRYERMKFLLRMKTKVNDLFKNKYFDGLFPGDKVMHVIICKGPEAREGFVLLHSHHSAYHHIVCDIWVHNNASRLHKHNFQSIKVIEHDNH